MNEPEDDYPEATKFDSENSTISTSLLPSYTKLNIAVEVELGSGACLQPSRISRSFPFLRFEEINIIFQII